MRLLGYCRVSTLAQVTDGAGADIQERLVRSWATSQGHSIARVIADNGVSGTLDETARPGLLEALERLGAGEARGIVVSSLDRLARSLYVQEAVLGRIWGAGARVFTVDGGEIAPDSPDDPLRRALRQIIGVIAELEKNMIVKRLRAGREAKARRGGHAVGPPPYGWRAEDGELTPVPEEQEILRRVRIWRADGISLRRIAALLESRGAPAPSGGRWHSGSLSRIARRVHYRHLPSGQEPPEPARAPDVPG